MSVSFKMLVLKLIEFLQSNGQLARGNNSIFLSCICFQNVCFFFVSHRMPKSKDLVELLGAALIIF